MKKTILYIVIVLLLTIITVGGTYAFFYATENMGISTNSHKLEVIYTGGTKIDKPLNLVKTKEEGVNTTVNIGVSQESVLVKANLYINIEEITSTIATEALTWEVYKVSETGESRVNWGTFDGNQKGDKVYIVTDYQLSTDITAFKVYIWLNGYIAGNETVGAKFKGSIGAETEDFTANIG